MRWTYDFDIIMEHIKSAQQERSWQRVRGGEHDNWEINNYENRQRDEIRTMRDTIRPRVKKRLQE